ncbi:hypothetical protein SprV_0602179200 [Sparganum proliferum]
MMGNALKSYEEGSINIGVNLHTAFSSIRQVKHHVRRCPACAPSQSESRHVELRNVYRTLSPSSSSFSSSSSSSSSPSCFSSTSPGAGVKTESRRPETGKGAGGWHGRTRT